MFGQPSVTVLDNAAPSPPRWMGTSYRSLVQKAGRTYPFPRFCPEIALICRDARIAPVTYGLASFYPTFVPRLSPKSDLGHNRFTDKCIWPCTSFMNDDR